MRGKSMRDYFILFHIRLTDGMGWDIYVSKQGKCLKKRLSL